MIFHLTNATSMTKQLFLKPTESIMHKTNTIFILYSS